MLIHSDRWGWKLSPLRAAGLMITQPLNAAIFLSESAVDMLYTFANCSGLDLIFGLNALLRTADSRWNSSNAQLLLDYCSSKGYNISWELGNGEYSWDQFVNKVSL